MKRILTLSLSLVLAVTALFALPFSAGAEEGVSGYIRVASRADYEEVEVYNGFHDPVELNEFKGASYDISTNTLTLSNTSADDKLAIMCDQMLSLKINVVGNCYADELYFYDTFPIITGMGTLTVKPDFPVDPDNDYSAISVELNNALELKDEFKDFAPLAIDSDVTVNLETDGVSNHFPYIFKYQSFEDAGFTTSNVLIYKGKASEAPAWLTHKDDGLVNIYQEYYQGSEPRYIRLKTTFPVTKLLKIKDSTDGRIFIPSLFSYTESKNCIALIEEKNGIWYETEDAQERYWNTGYNSEYEFEALTGSEISALPATLAEDGVATVMVRIGPDMGDVYLKDGEEYVFTLGEYYNSRLEPITPAAPQYNLTGNYRIKALMSKIHKDSVDGSVSWLEYIEEFDFQRTTAADNHELIEFAEAKGYSPKMFDEKWPDTYFFNMTNKSITFSPNKEAPTDSTTAAPTTAAPTTAAPAAETMTKAPAVQKETVALTLKSVKVKRSAKSLTLQATLKINKKAVKGKKVTFTFNGKKYTAKTDAKGVAKVTIKKSVLKKLKKGKKISYSAAYGKKTVKKTVKVQ